MRVTQPVTGASWLGAVVKCAPVCCVWVTTHLGTGSSLLEGSKVTHHCYNCNMSIIHWYYFWMLYWPFEQIQMSYRKGLTLTIFFKDYLCEKHAHNPSTHTSNKIGFKAFEIRLFFLPPKSFIPLSGSSPPLSFFCFLPLGCYVVNGGESLRDEKGKDATLGKLCVKDRGVDRWRGWAHERMTEERIE